MLRKLSQKKWFFSGCKTGDFYVLFENCLNVEKMDEDWLWEVLFPN